MDCAQASSSRARLNTLRPSSQGTASAQQPSLLESAEQAESSRANKHPSANMPPNFQQPALIVFPKIRLENVPRPPGRENHSLVRVKFRVSEGDATAETLPKLPNPDGSVEWTEEPVQLSVQDIQVLLIAVVSQRQMGSWSVVTGGRFEGPAVSNMLSNAWRSPSNGPLEPSFYAEAEVYVDDIPLGDVGITPPVPSLPVSDQVDVQPSIGSHDSFSMSCGTSLSSTGYESARDSLLATAPPGGMAPSGLQRVRSEGNNIETLRVHPSAIPTVAAVPVDPLGARTSPIIPHASAVRAERATWTVDYPKPSQVPPTRRARSGGYARKGSRGYARESNRRSRRPSFGSRRSSSHSEDSSIREESSTQSIDINSLTSPVGTYRESHLQKAMRRLKHRQNSQIPTAQRSRQRKHSSSGYKTSKCSSSPLVPGGKFEGPAVLNKQFHAWRFPSKGPLEPSVYAEAWVNMDDFPHDDVDIAPAVPALPVSDQVGVEPSSGSHDSFSMSHGTSLSSTRYERARDWLPTTASGGRAPSSLQRARSEGNNIEILLRAHPSAIPTVAAVPVDPLGARTSPIIPHASTVRAKPASWTTGYTEPAQMPSMRRTRSGGFFRQGSRGYVREGSRRSRRPSFGSLRSSSHSEDSSIREESPTQSIDINSLTSPVGTYRESRLLDEGCPLVENKEDDDEALESSRVLTRSWGGPALAVEIDRTAEEVNAESPLPPFAPAVDSPPDVPQSSFYGAAAHRSEESRSKERRPSDFFNFFVKAKRKTRRYPLAAGAMAPQFRSEYARDSSRRRPTTVVQEEKTTRQARIPSRRRPESVGEEDMKSTEPPADLDRPQRMLHRMPLQEAKVRDEAGALSLAEEADTGVVGSDRGETDSVAAGAEISVQTDVTSSVATESQGLDSTVTVAGAGATAEEVERVYSIIAKAVTETQAGAGTSTERPSWMKMDGLGRQPTDWVYEQLSPARPKPPLPPRPWNILGSIASMISTPASPEPDTDFVTVESPSRPAPSAPPLSPVTLPLPRAGVLFPPHPEIGSCSPVSHDEDHDEEKEDDYVDEDLAKDLSMSSLEVPEEALPARRRRGLMTSLSRGRDDASTEYVGDNVLLESTYARNLFQAQSGSVGDAGQGQQTPAMMQPNPPIQSNAPNSDRAVGQLNKDPVIFDCFAPRTVIRGMSFDLMVLAYLRQHREEVLRDTQRRGVVEAGMPKTIPIMRNKRVTVILDLPDNTFRVTQSYHRGKTLPHVREFIWTGGKAEANFNVECKPEAEPGLIPCGAKIIEGNTTSRLSFHLDVVQTGSDGSLLRRLEATVDNIEPNVNVINPQDLELVEVIGSGAQGKTWRGLWGDKRVAVKCLWSCPLSHDDLNRKAATLSLLGHFPHTVEFYGICRRSGEFGQEWDKVAIVTKFEEGGSIHDALGIAGCNGRGSANGFNGHRSRRSTAELNADAKLRWARHLATALADVHSKSVLHNDVACRNALLSRAGADGDAVLCDFGLSSFLCGDGLATVKTMDSEDLGKKWPKKQMPKEALDHRHCLSSASDTYMFGTMLYEMFEEKTPFADLDPREAEKLVLEGKTLEPPEMIKRQGPRLLKLYKECLDQDYDRRPLMEDIVDRLDACLPSRSRRRSPLVI